MKYTNGSYEMYELGDEIHPGFHVGDKIRRSTREPREGWVSNIKTYNNYEDRVFVIASREDPNVTLANAGRRPDHMVHGDWVMNNEIEEVTLVECSHHIVTDEEVAEVFGLTLLEMVPQDDDTL